MTDNRDDMLIRKFFDENMPEIEDRGFSDRVMRRLPGRTNRLNRIWTAFCAIAGIIIFTACRGTECLMTCFYDITAGICTVDVQHVQPVTLVTAMLVAAVMAVNSYAVSDD